MDAATIMQDLFAEEGRSNLYPYQALHDLGPVTTA